jgi:hypothetical protein
MMGPRGTIQRRGIYVHSDLPDDLGIQYQTYRTNAPFADNEHVLLHPGLGHTSCEPFDLDNGWYRGLRGLAGELTYGAFVKKWTIASHQEFPPAVSAPVGLVTAPAACSRHHKMIGALYLVSAGS